MSDPNHVHRFDCWSSLEQCFYCRCGTGDPRLSLSEIEARLTPKTRHKANVAAEIAEDASSDYVGRQDTSAVGHRAWLDVILAALGKEQS